MSLHVRYRAGVEMPHYRRTVLHPHTLNGVKPAGKGADRAALA